MSLAGLSLDEREMILDLIATLQERMLTSEKILELDEKEEFPLEIIQELLGPDIGLQLMFIPEEYGGMGGGARDIAAISEMMGGICLGVSTAVMAIYLGTDPILVGATHEQKERWLGRLADEGIIVAYAVSEPEAGSNLANLKTTAEPVTDDAGTVVSYRINGSKQFISNGGYADIVTVLADTPEGHSFFVVEKEMEGFTPGKPEVKHGVRCSNTSPLRFDDVLVPADNLIGGVPGEGMAQASEVFGYTRLMVASMGLGAGAAALKKAITYGKQRIQFGSTLMEKQGYTHNLILPHVVRLEAARAYIEETAERMDAGEKGLQVEGAIAKFVATEAANACADDAIQALGGYGYITEFEVEKIKRDVRITTIYEGTSQVLQMVIGTFRWRSTVKSKWQYYEDIAREMDEIHAQCADTGADSLAGAARSLTTLLQAVHKAKLTRSQFVMFDIADIMAHVETGAALTRKIQRLVNDDSTHADKMKTIGRLYAAELVGKAHGKFHRIIYGADAWDDVEKQALAASLSLDMSQSHRGTIGDMDRLAASL